ncbi:MAG TPA: tetratricopeptide repeat protein [Thermoanaerobaculia bacterium]|nr:tetratricopeptide repeat protein [Thermoanaerobaculia bacterium]
MRTFAAGIVFLLSIALAARAQTVAPADSGAPDDAASSGDRVSPLPPPATRSGLRGRWFEFLSALNEDDYASARLASADLLRTASRVGISRLSDFSRAALYQARLADRQGKAQRADLALETAIQLDPELVDPRWEKARLAWGRRQYADSAIALGEAVNALFEAEESRREFVSNAALLIGASFALAAAGLVLALMLRHSRRLYHSIRERAQPAFGRRGTIAAALVLLGLPLWLSFGPFWLLLYWSVLVCIHAGTRERIVLGAALLVVGFLGPLTKEIADRNLIARSPLVSAAVDLEEKKEEGGSVDLLRRASEVFSEDPDVWFLLGRFAQRRDDYDEAAADYARALKGDPKSFRAMIGSGNIHFWQGDLGEAMADYRDAIQVRPRSALAWYNLSLAQGDAYLFDQQRESLANARRLSPREVDRWIESPTLARVLSLDYSIEEAERRSRRWTREVKSQSLPGLGHAYAPADLFFVPTSIGPWLALLVGLVLGAVVRYRRWGARECARCGAAFCRRCKVPGSAALYCAPCDRLLSSKAAADIASQVAQSEEARRNVRQRQREARWLSVVFPGARRISEGRPATGLLILFGFFFFVLVALVGGRIYPVRSLPTATYFPVREIAATVLAFGVWVGANLGFVRS